MRSFLNSSLISFLQENDSKRIDYLSIYSESEGVYYETLIHNAIFCHTLKDFLLSFNKKIISILFVIENILEVDTDGYYELNTQYILPIPTIVDSQQHELFLTKIIPD